MDPEHKRGERLLVQDTATMRALAHPARIASLERLMRGGPATATELGQVAGLTPSAMSYHLRLLERAGLISTAPGRGDGRERVWQSRATGGWAVDTFEDGTADSRVVHVELLRSVLSVQELRLSRWLSRADEPGWLDTGYFTESTILATAEELERLGTRIHELLAEYAPANRPDPPADAVLRRAAFRSFPDSDPLPEGDVKE
jgi:DNA-binding transcriptional ArsR family regulator